MTCELFQTLHDALPALMGDTSHPASFPAAAELVVQALQVHHLPLALRLVQLLTADAATDTDTDTDTDINTNTNTNTNTTKVRREAWELAARVLVKARCGPEAYDALRHAMHKSQDVKWNTTMCSAFQQVHALFSDDAKLHEQESKESKAQAQAHVPVCRVTSMKDVATDIRDASSVWLRTAKGWIHRPSKRLVSMQAKSVRGSWVEHKQHGWVEWTGAGENSSSESESESWSRRPRAAPVLHGIDTASMLPLRILDAEGALVRVELPPLSQRALWKTLRIVDVRRFPSVQSVHLLAASWIDAKAYHIEVSLDASLATLMVLHQLEPPHPHARIIGFGEAAPGSASGSAVTMVEWLLPTDTLVQCKY